MLIPVRCISCGKPVAHLWENYKKRVSAGDDSKKVLDELGLKRYCCRALFIAHVDVIQEVAKFKR